MRSETVEIKRFDAKIEAKMLVKLSKILEQRDNNYTESEVLNLDEICVIDNTMVSVIRAKAVEARLFLNRFVDKSLDKPPIDQLDWHQEGGEIKTRYPLEYIKKYIDFFDAMKGLNDSLVVKIKEDYPCSIENKYFQVIIAPRVDN